MNHADAPLDTADAVAAALATGALINMGAINQALAPMTLNAAGLAQLGFKPVATLKMAKLYRQCELAQVRAALVVMLAQPSNLEDGREFMASLTQRLEKAPRAYRLAPRLAKIVDCATSQP